MTPNLLDRAISFVAPGAGARRMQARLRMDAMVRLGGYEGARTGRNTAGWITTNASGNAVLAGDLVRLRERSRELVRNNQYAINARDRWVDCIVGTGIRLQADKRVMDLWNRWEAECCDAHPSFYAMQRALAKARFESGEVLLRRRIRRTEDGGVLPLRIQVMESDFLDHTKESDQTNGRYVIQGVEFDPIGRRAAYWLHRRHPGDTSSSRGLDSAPVPAAEVIHLFEEPRPGAVRGVPKMHAVMIRMRDLDDYEFAHLLGKRTQACLAAFVTTPDGTPINSAMTSTSGAPLERIEPGTINYLKPGESVEFSAPRGDGGYGDYKTHIVRDIAAGIGMPYELVSGNLSTVNYSSYRAGLVAFKRAVEAEQWSVMIPMACEPVFRWFVEVAQVAGLLPTGPTPPHEWAPPEFALLDRLEEARADEAELAIGTSTWPQVVGRKGYDAEQQVIEIAKWSPRVAAALGARAKEGA